MCLILITVLFLLPTGCRSAETYRMDGLEKVVETLKIAPGKETYCEIEYKDSTYSSYTLIDIGKTQSYICYKDSDKNNYVLRTGAEQTPVRVYDLDGKLLREEETNLSAIFDDARFDFSAYLNTDNYTLTHGREKYGDIEYEYEKYTDKSGAVTTFYYSVSSGKLRHVLADGFSYYILGYSDNALETLFE